MLEPIPNALPEGATDAQRPLTGPVLAAGAEKHQVASGDRRPSRRSGPDGRAGCGGPAAASRGPGRRPLRTAPRSSPPTGPGTEGTLPAQPSRPVHAARVVRPASDPAARHAAWTPELPPWPEEEPVTDVPPDPDPDPDAETVPDDCPVGVHSAEEPGALSFTGHSGPPAGVPRSPWEADGEVGDGADGPVVAGAGSGERSEVNGRAPVDRRRDSCGSLTRRGDGGGRGRRADPASGGRPAAMPLIVTEDDVMLDDLLRLCAAAGVEPEVSFGPPADRESWEAAPLVLVGDECAAGLRRLPRRHDVLLVGRDLDDPQVWRRGMAIGADHVMFLPDGERWLIDRIADAAEGVGDSALTVGVIGGRGGAGASTLACALAVTAARLGHRTVLVDGDPLGGGLDVMLGAEEVAGLRWPDLAGARGRMGAGALTDSLPRLHDLNVLSWDRSDAVLITPEAMRSVLSAARRGGGLVVVDLPRRLDDAVVEALTQTDVGLLVVPGELRAVAAADRVASRAGMVLRDLRVVARGPFPPGFGEARIARLLGLPSAGVVGAEKGLAEAVDSGAPPGSHGRGPLARFCEAFLSGALRSGGSVRA